LAQGALGVRRRFWVWQRDVLPLMRTFAADVFAGEYIEWRQSFAVKKFRFGHR
jgi:hypothetical protein